MICVKSDARGCILRVTAVQARCVDNSDVDKIMVLLDVSCESQGTWDRTSCSFCIHLEVNHPQRQLKNSPIITSLLRECILK
ncbi:hypothetical protein OESDEN_15391 [Oesophagostomum dentatum]|uniref:Uncharacterized protein n=1 Tax=Oesophagostomum dentatum TaxID=61180 RepID=A0A0B1SHS1_OESDE|nr:hypothetical protein OESDEN_15391 [Oesophagostomum dentatum]